MIGYKDYTLDKKKMVNGVWGWLIGATVMLTAAAGLFQVDLRCMSAVPMFLFFVCLFMVLVSFYGLKLIHEQEEEQRISKFNKVVK